jgi:ubiquinone/menaquinone biosynthesis C-methylase UbiE
MTTFDPVQYKKIERDVYSFTAQSYEKFGSKSFEAYAQPLIQGVEFKPGYRVLDVACGPGIPSLMVSPLVEPGGTVTGIDLAPGMIELALLKAEERVLNNVSFQEADGESLPFPDEFFDVVLCNHGLVHMTNRERALSEMFRVLKKGRGTLALSVWSTPDKALTLALVAKAIRDLWPAAVIPGAPMWFDFGPEGALSKTLTDIGFLAPGVMRHTLALAAASGEEYWECVLGISGRLQMLLKNIPPETATAIKMHVIGAVENFRSEGQIRVPCEEVIAVAKTQTERAS